VNFLTDNTTTKQWTKGTIVNSHGNGRGIRARTIILAVVGVIVLGILWFAIGYYFDAGSRLWRWLTESVWGRGLFPGGWNLFKASAWFYLLVGIAAAIYSFTKKPVSENGEYDYRSGTYEQTTHGSKTRFVVSAVLSGLIIVGSFTLMVTNRDDRSDSYASSTTFVVPDASDLGTNLELLDNRSVKEGEYSQAWEPRVASASGADTVITRSSESDSGSKLLSDTLTYTYGDTPGWTAIRDGKKTRPLYGVAFWPGEGDVETCRFTGESAMSKAFHGKLGNNLLDEIAGFNNSLFFEEEDMWGYCDPAGDPEKFEDDRPVIVIPVKTWDGYGNRATWYSAGVIEITGSSSGKAAIKHVTDVKPGQYPGPVYPVSLAANQRQETQWMAGKWNKWFKNFGYENTDVESQAGNTSEFMLKSKSDGHLYWVTPLRARGSDSQLVVAYSMIRADQASLDTVNPISIYVLNGGDPRVVNLDDLEARTRQAISDTNPGFFSAKGKLVEFLPLDDENWQVYAELGGRVVYRIKVPTDSRIRPVVTELEGIDETPVIETPEETVNPETPSQGEEGTSACAANLSRLSDKELAECLSDIAKELGERQSSSK
jgi:hypothetical protein